MKNLNQKNEGKTSRFRYRLMAVLIAFAMVVQPAMVNSFQTVRASEAVEEVAAVPPAAEAPAETAAPAEASTEISVPSEASAEMPVPSETESSTEITVPAETAASEEAAVSAEGAVPPEAETVQGEFEDTVISDAPVSDEESTDTISTPEAGNTDAENQPKDAGMQEAVTEIPDQTEEVSGQEAAEAENTEDANENDDAGKEVISIEFRASEGGKVVLKEGGEPQDQIKQELKAEDYVKAVIATANEGYKFIKWTKGMETVSENAEFIAPKEAEIYVAVFEKEMAYPAQNFHGSANGLTVNVTAPEGALPEGTEMRVVGVASSNVLGAVENAINAEAENLKAVDITFTYKNEDGEIKEVEPEKPVNVKIRSSLIASAEEPKIVHIADNGSATVVGSAETAANELTFQSGEFSIYVVVEGVDPDARLTVNFWNYNVDEESPIAVMSITKNQLATELNTNIYDPGVGGVDTDEVFKGWTTEKNYNSSTADDPMTIEDVRTKVTTMLNEGSVEDGDELDIYAMIFKTYHITYRDELHSVIHTDEVLYKQGDTEIPYTVEYTYTPYYAVGNNEDDEDETANFAGWLQLWPENEPAPLYQNDTTINMADISDELVLEAKVEYGHWLIFKENGTGAVYTPPLFVENSETPAEAGMPDDPTRTGYQFVGWYYDADGTQPFNPNERIVDATTVFAKWNENGTADFTVLVWNESLTGGYDFVRSVKIEGAQTGSDMVDDYLEAEAGDSTITVNGEEVFIPFPADASSACEGFIYAKNDVNNEGLVAADNTSVLNVYFDRRTYRLKFYYARSQVQQNGQTVYYVSSNYDGGNPNRWAPDGSTALPGSPGTTQPGSSFGEGGTESRGGYTYYYRTLSAKYGANISASWPAYSQFDNYNTAGNRYSYRLGSWAVMRSSHAYADSGQGTVKGVITVMDEQILGDLSSPDGNYVYANYDLASTQYDWTYNIYFEKADGSGYGETPDEVVYARSHDNGTNWQNQQHPPAYPGMRNVDKGRVGSSLEINFYYERLKYPVQFMDGIYVNGSKAVLKNLSNNSLRSYQDDEAIKYGASVESFNSFDPTSIIADGSSYVFLGWYADDACTTPYTFTTMPEGGITVYAKWMLKEYLVTLHPNDGGDASFRYINGNGAGNYTGKGTDYFWCDEGEGIGNVGGSRDLYDLVGWFANSGLTKVWDFDAFELNDIIVGKYGKLYAYDGPDYDPDYPAVVGEINLYAGWRKILDGADGIDVVYNSVGVDSEGNPVEGTDAPVDNNKYSDQAKAIGYPAAKAPTDSDYTFQYWVVQSWNNKTGAYEDTTQIVYPGDRFKVNYDDSKKLVTKWKNPSNAEDVVIVEDPVPGVTPPDQTHTSIAQATYTVQLRAQYAAAEDATPTHITWYDNYNNSEEGIVQNDSPLAINETVDIPEAPARQGYTFLGWAKASETNDDGTTTYYTHSGLTEDDLFLTYVSAEQNYTYVNSAGATKIAAGVFADEQMPYDGMYAVWTPADVEYKVEFYYQSDDGSGYQQDPALAATRQAKTGSPVSATTADKGQTKSDMYSLNAQKSILEAEVAADGSTVLKLYFDLLGVDVTVGHYLKGETTPFKTETIEDQTIGSTYTAIPETTYQEKNLTVFSYDPSQKITVAADNRNIKIYYTLPLTIKAETYSKTYDGTPLAGKYTIEGALTDDEDDIQTGLGTAPSITNVIESPKEYQAAVDSVPAYYVVTNTAGTLTINKKPLELTASTKEKTYDGNFLNAEYTITDGGYVLGDRMLSIIIVPGPQKDVGMYQTTVRSPEIGHYKDGTKIITTDNYDITIIPGTMTVTPAPLTIKTDSASKVYDGTALTAGGTIEGFVTPTGGEQETATFTTTGSQIEAGFSDNTYNLAWDGTAKEDNYQITSETIGKLTVTESADEIVVTTTGGTFTYDGKAHDATVNVSTLPKGYILETATSSATATDVTTTPVAATCDTLVIKNESGTDVTAKLNIKKVDGEIVVNPAALTVITPSASKTYDGTALTAAGEISGFVNGETATFTTTGTQTLVGASDNTYSLVWDGTAKQANYTLSETTGMLTVTETDDPDKIGTKTHEGEKFGVGDTITWDIKVKNIYDETKDITLVEKDGIKLEQSSFEGVEPGEEITTTATYVVTEADLVVGAVENAIDVKFGDIEVKIPDEPATTEDPNPSMKAVKASEGKMTGVDAEGNPAYVIGDMLTYTITVTNDGNMTLKSISVVDEKLGYTADKPLVYEGSIAPGESAIVLTGTYTVTEDDVLAGSVLNQAAVTAKTDGGDPDPVDPKDEKPVQKLYTITYVLDGGEYNGDSGPIKEVYEYGETISIHEAPTKEGSTFQYWQGSTYDPGDPYRVTEDHTFTAIWDGSEPHLTITKSASSATAVLNDIIKYTITATNDGNITVRDIEVKDDLTGDSWKVTSLAPGESKSFTAQHKVTEDDVKAGKVVNTATATGKTDDPKHPTPTVTPGTVTVKIGVEAPRTGDNNAMILWAYTMITAMLGLAFLLISKRRDQNERA